MTKRQRPVSVSNAEPGLSERLKVRKRRYLILMGTCLALIIPAWTVVRLYSVPAALIMSFVAADHPADRRDRGEPACATTEPGRGHDAPWSPTSHTLHGDPQKPHLQDRLWRWKQTGTSRKGMTMKKRTVAAIAATTLGLTLVGAGAASAATGTVPVEWAQQIAQHYGYGHGYGDGTGDPTTCPYYDGTGDMVQERTRAQDQSRLRDQSRIQDQTKVQDQTRLRDGTGDQQRLRIHQTS